MTVQVIGSKIIAYNISTGIYDGASWYADDQKISENKDYLVYDVTDGTFPQNLKLKISNGNDIQETSVAIERNAKNKVLLRKITQPLVILTNASSTVEAAPDEIVWKDPTKPLFFYLGESTGDIQYYIIDNDVDVDTDLSGGKDDDIDNKGSPSYRLGRPYMVPIGNKRTTTMRFRIVKSDGTDIDSRQIRVVRDFISPPVDTGTSPSTPQTQTFNLSPDDKSRLDKLQNLVKNAPADDQKVLQRYVDQLGDIWYDRADRAETLLQFSNAVNDSKTMTSDLKSLILEQVQLIYTEGDQNAQDKDLARRMIADFLSKSPGQKDIFGDGTTDNPGLM